MMRGKLISLWGVCLCFVCVWGGGGVSSRRQAARKKGEQHRFSSGSTGNTGRRSWQVGTLTSTPHPAPGGVRW